MQSRKKHVMVKISVVIPTYNRAGLIGETLAAVFAQTLAPDEVIVVDDGSTDDTRSVLAGYGSRVRPLLVANGGELVARNTGLRAAAGDLVAFCDSDDLWMPDFLATMSAQWRAEPKLMACYSDHRILKDGALSARSKFADAPDAYWSGLRPAGSDAGVFDCPIVERLLAFQPLFPSCMMVSRATFLEAGGWDEGVSRVVGCDFATVLRVAARPPLGIVRRPLATIRKHAGNFSGDTERMNLGDARVLEHVLRTRPELAPLQDAIRNSVMLRRRDALDSAFSRSDLAAVREIYRLLPGGQPAMQRAKRVIAGLPRPLDRFVAALLSR
jgi:glycosyltransferase involved in cell wall biosynthesis